jgi:Protein of unknown function (DUF2950)
MRRMEMNFCKSDWARFSKLAAGAILLIGFSAARVTAQQPGQRTFSSPEDASKALASAAQSNDEKAMLDILGPDGKEIVSSGDAIEDAHARANFAEKYQQMHRLMKEPDGTTTLYIGAENWPTPIPIMHKDNSWYFDTDAGKKEIVYRRVGRNEMSAIRICQELVAAQKEYFGSQHNEYAQKIFSDSGQHNGLFWKAADTEPQSPIGPLVASAVAEGYTKGENLPPTPYRGYYFRVLIRQGKNAPGGAENYVANGKMTGGFAFLAYPAEYRSSGVMTFIVAADGAVYEKDLGAKTEIVAKAMKEYDPGAGWKKSEDMQEHTASEQKPK